MDIIKKDFKKGSVQIRITDSDDLWHLSSLIDSGDRVRGTATRKIKIGDGDNAKVVKKKITLTIIAEKVEYVPENDVTRVNGKILLGPEDIPRGSYQSIVFEKGEIYTLEKNEWLTFQKEALKEASSPKFKYLFCLFDRDSAMFALSKKSGFTILTRLKSDLPKKAYASTNEGTFYQEMIKMIEEYNLRHKPERIILAAPGFYKNDPIPFIKNEEIKKKISSATCSTVSPVAIEEVMRSPELKDVLKNSRSLFEIQLVEELLSEIGKSGAFAYGFDEVKNATESGATKKLIVTNGLIHSMREKGEYNILDTLLKTTENIQGEVHILTSDNEAGKKLDGLGGIAAILRYSI